MPVLQAKLEVVPGTPSSWVNTDGTSNIVIGAKGPDQVVEFHLGDENSIYSQRSGNNATILVIAKAAAVRLKAKGPGSSWFEVFG